MNVPYWVEDAIFYQIFPDRFANGDPSNDPVNVKPWGSQPTLNGFQGGDLRGILNHLDYLLDLGVNSIYLNPIFESASTHRYNINNYFKIDPKLGDLNDFRALIDGVHSNGMRLILDGVFNHCGRGFFAFTDLLDNQQQSCYKDWFYVQHFPIDAYSHGDATDYTGWWKYKALPKLNSSNPDVRKYIMRVARYWIEQGADGWRLDVPNEIDDDSFWAEFRQVVRSTNPDAYLLGEIWEPLPRWISDGHFDGLMNYPVREVIMGWLLNKIKANQVSEKMERLLTIYPRENIFSMYSMLSSHDVERILTMLGEKVELVKLAYLFLFSLPGAPAIYYGDEIGMEGDKDPDCRRAFPWEPEQWNKDLRFYIQNLISFRKRLPALRRGNYQKLYSDDIKNTYAFVRTLGGESVVVAINPTTSRVSIRIPVGDLGWHEGMIVHNLLSRDEFIVSGSDLNVTLPPFTGMWLK